MGIELKGLSEVAGSYDHVALVASFDVRDDDTLKASPIGFEELFARVAGIGGVTAEVIVQRLIGNQAAARSAVHENSKGNAETRPVVSAARKEFDHHTAPLIERWKF